MKNRTAQVCLVMVFALILLVPSINADWTEGGIELCTNANVQSNQQVTSDGAGGAIVVWQDEREGASTWDVYAQRFDGEGNVLWDAGGVNISQLGSSQLGQVLVSDGAGGAIIVYRSNRAGSWDIIAQRIRPDGTLAWSLGGLTVCGASNDQDQLCIVSDNVGGAIVAWQDFRSGVSWDIYAARINSSGSMPWTYNGVSVCQAADHQQYPEITTDGSSGAIIAWEDPRAGNDDIYAQKINFLGSYVWTNNGNAVVDDTGDQSIPSIISDMSGGAIIAWTDGVTSEDIRAERMLSDGTQAWNPGTGVAVCTADNMQFTPYMVSDDAGGAIIAWTDHRSGNADIYAQHIDFAGGTDWYTDGVYVCYDAGTQLYHEIVSDGFGGAIILWTDWRYTNNYEIFGQHLDAGGTPHWFVNGENLTSYPADQQTVKAIATSDGGIIAVWWDERDMSNPYKLYAQKYDRYGYWGDPAPVIIDASDVPADQGGQVLLTWSPVRMDVYPEELITHYTIWRSVSAPAAVALIDEESVVKSPGAVGLDFEGTAYRFDILNGTAAAWEWVASVDAHYWEEYAYTCGTLQDFIEGGDDAMHYFVITANTAYPFTFWDSAPDSAWSVDNLSPCTPLGLAGEQSYEPEGLELTWAPNTEADLGGYNIYRGTDPTFEPDPSYLMATTCEMMIFDGDWSWDAGLCYKVAAEDIHGNESEYAVLCFEQVTGDDPMPLPDATFLAQNFPNPFNPNTTIAFGLKTSGFVNLSIYNAAGQLVTVLINESRPAGQYSTVWNGKSENGTPAASGVYFYKFETEEFAKTRKMILLR